MSPYHNSTHVWNKLCTVGTLKLTKLAGERIYYLQNQHRWSTLSLVNLVRSQSIWQWRVLVLHHWATPHDRQYSEVAVLARPGTDHLMIDLMSSLCKLTGLDTAAPCWWLRITHTWPGFGNSDVVQTFHHKCLCRGNPRSKSLNLYMHICTPSSQPAALLQVLLLTLYNSVTKGTKQFYKSISQQSNARNTVTTTYYL